MTRGVRRVAEDHGVVTEEREFVVNGEVFLVRLHEDGGFDCVWTTGPNPGYGFGSGAPASYTTRGETSAAPVALPTGRASDDRVRESIRNFLSMIDAQTGFIRD